MFAVSSFIRESGLLALIKLSLKSFRKGNLALSEARSLSELAELVVSAGSFTPPVCDASLLMHSRALMIVAVSSSEFKSFGIPRCKNLFRGEGVIPFGEFYFGGWGVWM